VPGEDVYSRLERKVEALRQRDKSSDDREVIDEVFDKDTLLAVYKLMKEDIIDTLEFSISTGKEGNVFLCTTIDGGLVAMKIFRISTSTFKRISRYIDGDPRFKGLVGSRRKVIFAWTSKEFRNLQRLERAGVRVPHPIRFLKNLLVMEYIGDEESPAPMMRELRLDQPQMTYDTLIEYVRLAYQKAGLVHGDLSEYNVLIFKGEAVIIDCGQAVMIEHPQSREFLRRDIENINRFFGQYEIDISGTDKIMQMVMGG